MSLARAFPVTAARLRRTSLGMRVYLVLVSPVLLVLALAYLVGIALLGCAPDDGEHGPK